MNQYLDIFKDAIIDIDYKGNTIYDKYKMIEILMDLEKWDEESTIDYLEYNIWYSNIFENVIFLD